jgi:hypothetical protein
MNPPNFFMWRTRPTNMFNLHKKLRAYNIRKYVTTLELPTFLESRETTLREKNHQFVNNPTNTHKCSFIKDPTAGNLLGWIANLQRCSSRLNRRRFPAVGSLRRCSWYWAQAIYLGYAKGPIPTTAKAHRHLISLQDWLQPIIMCTACMRAMQQQVQTNKHIRSGWLYLICCCK